MKVITRRALFWSPRVLCILLAIFVSMFALDVFGENAGLWQTIGALLINLVPAAMVVVVLVVAWRWEWVGAVLFIALAILYVAWGWRRLPLIAYFSISGPAILVGALFLLNWIYRAQVRAR